MYRFVSGSRHNPTGKMFGDEFDLPIEEATLVGDQVRFVVITKNYYSGTNTKFVYSGTVSGFRDDTGPGTNPDSRGEGRE